MSLKEERGRGRLPTRDEKLTSCPRLPFRFPSLGVLDFIPIMTIAYNLAPQAAFVRLLPSLTLSFPELTPRFRFAPLRLPSATRCSLSSSTGQMPTGSSIDHLHLFPSFVSTDALFLRDDPRLLRRKGKMFRFTPSPVSSASIFWWAGKGGFATRKCLFDVGLDTWFDERFPPLSIYYVSRFSFLKAVQPSRTRLLTLSRWVWFGFGLQGGRDFLVLTEPLLDRLAEKETEVKVIRVKKLDLSEVGSSRPSLSFLPFLPFFLPTDSPPIPSSLHPYPSIEIALRLVRTPSILLLYSLLPFFPS